MSRRCGCARSVQRMSDLPVLLIRLSLRAPFVRNYVLTILHLQTCRALHAFAMTRPVYRNLAAELLRRCRALPLHGFQRLPDLSDDQAIVLMPLEGALQLAVPRLAPGPCILRLGDLTFKVAMTYQGWDKGNVVAVEILEHATLSPDTRVIDPPHVF